MQNVQKQYEKFRRFIFYKQVNILYCYIPRKATDIYFTNVPDAIQSGCILIRRKLRVIL